MSCDLMNNSRTALLQPCPLFIVYVRLTALQYVPCCIHANTCELHKGYYRAYSAYVHCERVGSSVIMIEFVLMIVCMQGSTHSCTTGPGHIVFKL